jgi:hypothetical protein
MIQYFPDVNREAMKAELSHLINEVEDVIYTLPTFLYFEGCIESKVFEFMYPSKLSDVIYTNLQVLKERGWNAVVVIKDGVIHVFFGNNNGMLDIPQVIIESPAGSC